MAAFLMSPHGAVLQIFFSVNGGLKESQLSTLEAPTLH
jgi:hypothetical protein